MIDAIRYFLRYSYVVEGGVALMAILLVFVKPIPEYVSGAMMSWMIGAAMVSLSLHGLINICQMRENIREIEANETVSNYEILHNKISLKEVTRQIKKDSEEDNAAHEKRKRALKDLLYGSPK